MEIKHLTPIEVIFKELIRNFSTPAVEQNLSDTAHLQDDLSLTSIDVTFLGMYIESHYQQELNKAFHIPDVDLLRWKTIPDILETLNTLLGQLD